MPSFLRFALRWVSYPLVFGGSATFMIWTLYTGVPYWPTTPLVAAVGLLLIAGLERIQPFREAWLEDHQDTATDLLHMLVNLSVIQFTVGVLVEFGDAVPASVRLFPNKSPLWLQLLLVIAVLDLSLYAMHRISHRVYWLWRFHMPHHSAERLYWMNGERRHPLHAVLMASPGLVILFASGAPSAVVATWFGVLTVHLAFQHSNLDYRVGWLRHIIGVAEIHRWHHKRDFEDAQVNYGEFLMVWDRIFGTFYDSLGRLGQAEVGLHETDYPKNYLGQLIEPFEHDRVNKG
ncbi:sterol desaturase family protein [Pseudomonas sp. ANT_H12B]|uniref:sterol desaturase family protein n=1 Tax=Pseudomonas sp. ANT_H12B TaxID=2597348 RepID=UPI0011EBA6D5|nr:sterol desaturase family protein [Pseudomonas sp. ANT_H12B]KAA0963685.1 sterol desaturase family protein [Pseudomonas sp. ANT_H12B]